MEREYIDKKGVIWKKNNIKRWKKTYIERKLYKKGQKYIYKKKE